MTPSEPISVLLVDDHPVVRDGLRGQLSTAADVRVVAEAGSAEEALAVLHRRGGVDVVVTDLRMPGLGGAQLIRSVRARYPNTEVLVLTTYDTDDDVGPALAAGARGYLLKDAGRATILEAIRAARRGVTTLAPSVQSRPTSSPPIAPPLLTPRELEVLRLVAAARTNAQIGGALFIGEATVKTHLQHIFAKLEAADRAAAVAAGYRRNLL